MSKFFTAIPVDVEAVRKLLPAKAFEERLVWNREQSRVELHWDHWPFDNGTDFATEFSRELLEQKKLPEGVRIKQKGTKQTKVLADGHQTKALPHGGTPPGAARTRRGKALAASVAGVGQGKL